MITWRFIFAIKAFSGLSGEGREIMFSMEIARAHGLPLSFWKCGEVILSPALCEKRKEKKCQPHELSAFQSLRIAFRDSWEDLVILLWEMSDVNMDLLELEDGCVGEDGVVFPDSVFSGDMSQQNVEGDFPEEGEEEAEGEDDESVATSFLRYNPDIEVEIRFEELYLREIQLTFEQPLQRVLGSTIDVFKKTLVDRLYYVFQFPLIEEALPAYMMWITNKESWERVSFDNTVEEELNRYQERTRLSKYFCRIS